MRLALALLAATCLTACGTPKKSPPAPVAQLITEIYVRDLATSRAFYEKLGFKVTHTEPTFLDMTFGGRRLFLSQRKAQPPTLPGANIRIGVTDLNRYWNLAKSMHAKVLSPIADHEWGERDFLIADPDGFGLRFAELLPNGKW